MTLYDTKYIATKDGLSSLAFVASRSEPASTGGYLWCDCGQARRLYSRIMVVFVVQRIDRYSYFSVYLLMLLHQALLSQVFT